MISRYGICLRLVEEADAEFILALRTNPKLNQYISHTNPNISDQINWIQKYKIKEEQGLEYYFISQDQKGNKYGTIRIYNLADRSFELGSWVFMPNSPLGMAVKTHIIGIETGFEQLNADFCTISIRKKNTGVVRYIEGLNAILFSEDDLDFHFTISKENFYNRKEKLPSFLFNRHTY